jgi:hypothetical protein
MSLLIQVPKNLIDTEIISLHYGMRDKYYKTQEIVVVECEKRSLSGNWKNSDRELRDWWLENKQHIKDEIIYITEYKKIVNGDLPKLPGNLDLAGKVVQTIEANPKWVWWREANQLSSILGDKEPIGISSFGFYIVRRWVLDAICDPKYDNVYKKTIQNELRFATVALLCGAKIGEIKLPTLINNSQKISSQKQDLSKLVGGVGTELSKTLEAFGIKSTPNCSCKKKAKIMDKNGIEWCESNKDTIIGWLEEEATKRKLIFSKTIAKIILNRAIKSAKKNRDKDSDNSPST